MALHPNTSVNLRLAMNLFLVSCPQNYESFSRGGAFLYRAPKLRDSIPTNIRDSVSGFKSKLNTYFFSQTFSNYFFLPGVRCRAENTSNVGHWCSGL